MEKLIITAATNNPAVLYTVKDLQREAKSAYDSGASIIRINVREDDGTPTQDINRFKNCIEAIKEVCPDVIIQPTTYINLNSEIATLNCCTCDEDNIKESARKMMDLGVKPEIEVFDKGLVDMALRLHKQGYIKDPMHFNFVMGVNCGISATPRDLMFLKDSIRSWDTFTVSGIGKSQFQMAALSILLGGHVSVLAKSNGELVDKVVRIAKELGREIATPQEAREILGLEGR
jgi:3-keto-5-aminohexanoate cleavage enzyme